MSYNSENLDLEKLQKSSEKLNKMIQEKESLKERIKEIEEEIEKLTKKQKNEIYDILNSPQNPNYVLAQDENILYHTIGLLSYYNDYMLRIDRKISPRDIYILTYGFKRSKKTDVIQYGKNTFEENLPRIKEKFCRVYNSLEKSGLLNDTFQVYLAALTLLVSNNIPIALAAMMAGLIAKQGPKVFCK